MKTELTIGDKAPAFKLPRDGGGSVSLADFKGGKESAINGFKGPIMKAAKGKANPKLVDEILRRLLAEAK